ncbi:MAG: TauD/TfdA family dioxygenase [Acetobacteraceae bacterium]|nr:TauD/TfdA family dioxygenase [Acetobacteraceae bacterium]
MTLSIHPIDPVSSPFFGGVASGIDLTQPITADQAAEIEKGMDRFGVMVFHDQRLSDEAQMAFSRHFGELEFASNNLRDTKAQRLGAHIADISNLDIDNNVLARENRRRLFSLGTRLWHSDSSFKVVPAKYSLLSARIIPSKGGNTEFADMRAAYDTLDDATRAECEGLVCEHSQLFSRAQIGFGDFTDDERREFAPVKQRLIRRHPSTGWKSLYLASHAGTIVDWPIPEARAFLRDLIEHATQRQFVYAHEWKQFDLVIWDNQATMHRGRPFDAKEVRDMHRTTIAGLRSTLEEAA